MTIVGVVKNVRQSDWTGAPDHEMYLPYLQRPNAFGLTALPLWCAQRWTRRLGGTQADILRLVMIASLKPSWPRSSPAFSPCACRPGGPSKPIR
jgi:hypothetical protein